MNQEYICIVCPRSCHLMVSDEHGTIEVTGNTCKRGYDHGVQEFTAPVRMLTTTVAIGNAYLSRLPVISSIELPKEKMNECLEVLYGLHLEAPITCGDIIVENICNTGIEICASRTMNRKGEEL
ncbi:DUF1667 domain-containing protein [Clostridium sp. CS001]|uniref:DUF1667 domain-containing protein n=1 Tax=Clostridium sp. CS001 TaxID=2880648 RepID=UPI001CF1C3BA|nr:DUF1667 domain-containing protein [Clostridium sp. CS001]MCB2289848.1 DUF1667 domain-containing protein [Clostridium sp. CS001]